MNDELRAYDELYYTYEIRNGNDTTAWKKGVEQAMVFDSLCQKLVSINEQTEQLLPQVKAFSSKLYKLYTADVKKRTATCPQNEEKLKDYISTVEGWRLENVVMIKLMEKVPQMEAASKELLASTNAEVAKAYKDAEKNASIQLKDDYSEYGVNVINWMKAQAQYKELDQMYTTIRESETKLNELLADKTLGDVKKVYTAYAKAHPSPITEDLQAAKQEAQSVMQVINDCEQFSKTRLKIAEQDQALTEQGKNFKNIAKEYAKYMKAANLAWTAEASADMSQLNAVLAVQSKIAAAYARSDAAELDKAVKKAKVKSLEDILQLIK
ncbi:MAG: hypothetical protein II588_02155 [Paludibacteraceae bacterium]|nr:hypothetical protein [Paludibacteraceae bacterium]